MRVVDVWVARGRRTDGGTRGAVAALGAEVPVCAPPDFAERLAGADVPLVPADRCALRSELMT